MSIYLLFMKHNPCCINQLFGNFNQFFSLMIEWCLYHYSMDVLNFITHVIDIFWVGGWIEIYFWMWVKIQFDCALVLLSEYNLFECYLMKVLFGHNMDSNLWVNSSWSVLICCYKRWLGLDKGIDGNIGYYLVTESIKYFLFCEILSRGTLIGGILDLILAPKIEYTLNLIRFLSYVLWWAVTMCYFWWWKMTTIYSPPWVIDGEIFY